MTTKTPSSVSQAKAKTTRAKKPTASELVAKIHRTAIEFPQPAAPDLAFVPLDLIDTAAQVRTIFEDETLQELAADIAGRGVLQPVLLRPTGSGRFLMIAGERRLRAARLAGLAAIPALVGELNDEAVADMQFAENIQRDELSLKDTAAAVRALFDRLGSLQAVAERVHKSKPWVSKHLAVSLEGFCYLATNLLESGSCEDLETLIALNKVYEIKFSLARELHDLIAKGQAGRATAREYIKKAKEQRAAEDEQYRQEEAEREKNREKYAQDQEQIRRAQKAQAEKEHAEFAASVPSALIEQIDKLFEKFEDNDDEVSDYLWNVCDLVMKKRERSDA